MTEEEEFWYCGLDPHDDEDGGMFYFAMDVDDEQSRLAPRELLAHLCTVILYVLDNDLLEGNEVD